MGYGRSELRDRICGHPNWEVVSCGKWCIDHIFPIKAFTDHGIHDCKVINCLENLRPISDMENMSKGGNYNKEDFLFWLHTKG